MPLPRRFAHVLALSIPMSLAGLALGTPPTDAAIDGLIQKIKSSTMDQMDAQAKRDARREAAKDELKSTPLAEATLAQIQKIFDARVVVGTDELAEAIDARLVELAKNPGLDGAKAAELRLQTVAPAMSRSDAEKRPEKIADVAEQALKHPGIPELFKAGEGETLIRSVASLSPELLKSHGFFDLVAPYINGNLSPNAAIAVGSMIQPLVEMKDSLGAEKFESLRQSMAKAVDSGLEKAIKDKEARDAKAAADSKPKDGGGDEKPAAASAMAKRMQDAQVGRLKDLRSLINGAWAKGELVDHAAPAITFEWSSGDKPIKSFADLKGRVVLVDFWATWCGPCVAAFPKMRELQSRYGGYPVTILGVTSDQGSRAMERKPGQKPKPVDCTGDPAKEHDLAKEFMKDMEMTWTVAFSEQNVFNPNFGIRGIPSVAIIDPKGVVRFAGLYPNPAEESEKIDGLLKEAKMPYPEQPYMEPKKEEPKKEEAKKDEPKKG